MGDFSLKKIDKSNWKESRFDEIAFNISERVEPTTTDLEIYVGLEHLDPESLHIKRFGKRTDVKGTKLKVYPGDIIFGRRRAYQRKAAIANFEGFCSAHALVLRANPDVVNPKLFPFFLHSDSFMNRAVEISVGSLSPTINWGTLKKEKFLLPPKNQQSKIAELFWAADDMIERLFTLKKNLFWAYNTIIEKQLLSVKEEKTKLSKLGKVIRGVCFRPEELLDSYSDDKCIILRANNISDGYLNYEEINILSKKNIKDDQLLKKGDFAICMSNGSKELVGKSACYYAYDKNVSVGSFCSIFRPNSEYNKYLLIHLFASNTYRFNIKRTTSGSNINNLKPSDVENIEFKINNSCATNGTITKLNSLSSSISYIDISIEKSKAIITSLLNKIFN